MNPKITIIIPVYNSALYIKESLLSALNQTYDNIEYVIVDDCGHDNSIELVMELSAYYKSKEIKILHHPYNKGQSAARNLGIEESTGEYIFFMDSDDILSKDCIKLHYELISKFNADYTDANFTVVNGRECFPIIKNHRVFVNEEIVERYFDQYKPTSCNQLYRRSFLREQNIQFIEGIVYEDIIWPLEVAIKATSMVEMPEYTYNYIIHNNSTTTHRSQDKVVKQYNSWAYIFNYLLDFAHKSNDEKIQNKVYKLLSSLRFKCSARLVSLPIDAHIKREYYNLLNSEQLKDVSCGFYGIFCKMPYFLFSFAFSSLYILFKKFKTIV